MGNKKEMMLVFNIGSSSVEGALFFAQKSGVPEIIFTVKEPIILENEITTTRFLSLTMQALDIVAHKIFAAGFGTPKEIFCVLSSPWHVSQTRIINFKKNTPFLFTAKLAESLVQKEINLFEEEHSSKTINLDAPNRTIEFKNLKTTLNGYETREPINKKINELEMNIFISMGEEKVLKKIENTIGKYFNFQQIRFSSFSLASFAVVRDMNILKENFILLDVGGEMTNITMVKNNILRESSSFPLGRNFLVRGVADQLKCNLHEANSLISLFKDGHAEKSIAQKISFVLEELKGKWLKSFEESLTNLSADISIPSTIYLTTDKDLADFFCQAIKAEQFNQYTLAESKFEVIFLGSPVFHGIALFKESATREPSLTIDSIYINRFLIKI